MKIENFYVSLPDSFALKDFVDRYSFNVSRAAVVQLRNRNLNLSKVILFILHNV